MSANPFLGFLGDRIDHGFTEYYGSKTPPKAPEQPDNAHLQTQVKTEGNYAPTGADAGKVNLANNGLIQLGGVSMSKGVLGLTAALLLGIGATRLMRG